jgi:hypothetical protein
VQIEKLGRGNRTLKEEYSKLIKETAILEELAAQCYMEDNRIEGPDEVEAISAMDVEVDVAL